MKKNVYIVGAGVAGLSASCYATQEKKNITVFESANHAGGRCRSYLDKKLNLEIDNGNHLVLSANTNFLDLCNLIRSSDTINELDSIFDFFDFKSKKSWKINIDQVLIPYWIFNK